MIVHKGSGPLSPDGRRGDSYDPVERSHLNTNENQFLSNDDKLLASMPNMGGDRYYESLPVHNNLPDSHFERIPKDELRPNKSAASFSTRREADRDSNDQLDDTGRGRVLTLRTTLDFDEKRREYFCVQA